MKDNYKEALLSRIIAKEDQNGCWNVLDKNDSRSAEWNYYVPTYNSTLWTLLFIADIDSNTTKGRFLKPLDIISNYFYDKESGIFTIGKSHFPIPCLNGNMLYLHNYFKSGNKELANTTIDFFHKYQRFDDGDYKTPSTYPYFSNKSCYGKHSCYWGIVKLLKGLSFIQKSKRTKKAKELANNCVEYVLKHKVCYSSREGSKYLYKNIESLTFPNMYHADFLEILWLLKREGIDDNDLKPSLELLRSKKKDNDLWELEAPTKRLIIPFGKSTNGNDLVSERAREVYYYYNKK